LTHASSRPNMACRRSSIGLGQLVSAPDIGLPMPSASDVHVMVDDSVANVNEPDELSSRSDAESIKSFPSILSHTTMSMEAVTSLKASIAAMEAEVAAARCAFSRRLSSCKLEEASKDCTLPAMLKQSSTNEQKQLLAVALEAMQAEVAAVDQLLQCSGSGRGRSHSAPGGSIECILAAPRVPLAYHSHEPTPVPPLPLPPAPQLEPLEHIVSSHKTVQILGRGQSSTWELVQRAMRHQRCCHKMPVCKLRRSHSRRSTRSAASSARSSVVPDDPRSRLAKSAPTTASERLVLEERCKRSESRLMRFRHALAEVASPRNGGRLDGPSRRLIDWGSKNPKRARPPTLPDAVRENEEDRIPTSPSLPRLMRLEKRSDSVARWEFAGLRDHGLMCLDPGELMRTRRGSPRCQSNKLRRLRQLSLQI